MMKHLLNEAYATTKRMTGINPQSPNGFKQMLADQHAWGIYMRGLNEGLDNPEDIEFMNMMGENTRVALMENSMFQLNPYETLTMPILRVFVPKFIAKELVNVMPIDKPDVIKGFIRASFKKHGESTFGHSFPSTTDISRGPDVGITVTKSANEGTTDVLAEASLTSTNSHIEKDVVITTVVDSTGNTATVSITPSVDGNFSEAVTVAGQSDVISGHWDFLNGTLTWSSAASVVTSVRYQAICSLEENTINPTAKFEIDKIRFTVIDRRISAEWTINMEQDIKALYDIQIQSEFVNLIGEQIALDIDNEIITALFATNAALNPATHTKTFDLNPPTDFHFGRKQWYENILVTLGQLSAQIYNSCLMGAANTLACNPLDASIFEALNGFAYTGDSVAGGDVGYRTATVAGGKWKILVSSIVPSGSILAKYRSDDLARAAYVYAPYVPALLSPYPLGSIPSLTVMSRYATKVIRNEAIGKLTITDTA